MPSPSGHYTLQTEELEVIVLPNEGGRISSLKSRLSGLEFLTQSHRNDYRPHPALNADFRDGPCAGIEECLPTVAACGTNTEGGIAPDHGDFWQLAWNVVEASAQSLVIEAKGFSRPFLFRKTISVKQNALHIAYIVRNEGGVPQSFLYACHPLFAVDAGDRIFLPQGIATLRLDYSKDGRLGHRGSHITWPVAESGLPLDEARSSTAGTADMLYTDRISRGDCGIHRKATEETLHVLFDTNVLPYLGIWLCYGGWPDELTEHLQYAVALEPTTSPFNALDEAQKANAAVILQPGADYAFDITFRTDQGKR